MKRRNTYTLTGGENMQQKNLGKAMRYLVVVCALASAFAMVGCGGDGDDGTTTTSTVSNQPVPINATNVQAVAGQQFVIPDGSAFSSGLPATPITVAFGSQLTTTTSAVTLTSGSQTATGTAEFGSCTFRISTSTITGLPSGTNIPTFSICSFVVSSNASLQQGGAAGQGTVIIQLGRNNIILITTPSVTVTIALTATGQVVINNVNISVTVTPTTGTTGTGGTP